MTPFIEYIKQNHPNLGLPSPKLASGFAYLQAMNPIFDSMRKWAENNTQHKFTTEDFNQLYSLLKKSFGKHADEVEPSIFRHFLDEASTSKLSDDLIESFLKFPVPLDTEALSKIRNNWPNLSENIKQMIYDNPLSPNVLYMLDANRHTDSEKHSMKTDEIEKFIPKFFDKEYVDGTRILETDPYSFHNLIDHYFSKSVLHPDKEKYKALLKKIPLNEMFIHHAPQSLQEKVALRFSPEEMDQYIDVLHKEASKVKTSYYDRPIIPKNVLSNPNFRIDHLNKIANLYAKGSDNPLLVAKHLYGKVPLKDITTGMYERVAPYFVDLSSTDGAVPDVPFINGEYPYGQFNRAYLNNPTFKIQPEHLRYGLPPWMVARAQNEQEPEGAKLSEKSKQYLSEYANALSEVPAKEWKEIFQYGPDNVDSVFARLAEWNPKAYQKIEDLERRYKSDFFGLGKSGALFPTHLAHIIHFMSDHDPRSLGKLLSTLPEYLVGVKKQGPLLTGGIFGRQQLVDVGKINNPEVFAHITNRNVIDTLLKYGVNTEHPNFQKVKDVMDDSYRRLIDRDVLNNDEFHMHNSMSSAGQKILNQLMEGNAFDYFSDKKAEGHVMVKRGSATLRYLRDHLEKLKQEGIDSVDPKTLPKDKTWNSILSATRHMDKQGNVTEHVAIDWNPLRDLKKGGKITQESVQKYIDSMSPKRYNLSLTDWEGDQRHSDDPSTVLNVNLSNEHIQQLKRENLWNSYKKISEQLPDGHPQSRATLGWVRFTKGPHDKDPVFVDEMQSDMMGAIERAVNKDGVPEEHGKRISQILFDGVHPSEILHEAFQEYGRKNNWVGKTIRMHSSDSKKLMSLNVNKPVPVHFIRTYEDVPKKRLNAEPALYGDHESESGTSFFDKTANLSMGGDSEKMNKFRRIWQTQFRKTEEDPDEYNDWDETF